VPVTRFGLEGYGVRRVGSFSNKTPDAGAGPHPVGVLTRFGLEGYGVRRAGNFGSKTVGAVTPTPTPTQAGGAGGLITFLAWKSPTEAEVEKVRLELRLRKEHEKLKKIEKKIATVEKKVATRTTPVPDGVLANLGSLRERVAELRRDIEITTVDLLAIKDFLGSLRFDDDDEEDIEVLLLGL
jgi:hypothetical protein